jgi:hypothetical protein
MPLALLFKNKYLIIGGTMDKLELAEIIASKIRDKGFESYEDTEMLVTQGLETWSENELLEKLKKLT